MTARHTLHAARLPANWHGDRCGHNFPILQCPYHGCVSRELYDALDLMLTLFGKPHPEEYVDGGAGYRLACETVERARAALATARAVP